jgi:hypothetical protein
MWDRGKSMEKDDRVRRASQLFSHSQLMQKFARQKVSTTQNKSDKNIYGDVLESASLLQQKLGLEETLNVSDFPDLRKSLDLFTSTCKDMGKDGELTVEKVKVFVNVQATFSKAISSTHHQHHNFCTTLKENGLLRMTASLDKLYHKTCGQFEGDQEMDRVRKSNLQDQRYMLVPLSTPLIYDFKGGGGSTRDARVKFTDLTKATGNGLTALALVKTHLYKSSWTEVLKEFEEIISLDKFFDVQYHSCLNNFEPVVWANIKEFQRKYGDLTGKMMGDLILASAFYNSVTTHVTKVRQILERNTEYDTNIGDFTNQLEKMTQFQVVERTKTYEIHIQGSKTLFEKPLSRAETELKKKEKEGKTQKYDGLKKSDGGALTFTVNQVSEILETVCVHFGVDTHPICDKCHM